MELKQIKPFVTQARQFLHCGGTLRIPHFSLLQGFHSQWEQDTYLISSRVKLTIFSVQFNKELNEILNI